MFASLIAGAIRFSADGGETFVSQTAPSAIDMYGGYFLDSADGWIAADDGWVIHTTNAGQNWNYQNTPSGSRLYDVCFVDSDHGWVVGRNGTIMHTSDGGAVWSYQSANISERLYSVEFSDLNNGWVVGWGGTVLHTTNGGTAWQSLSLGDNTERYHISFGDQMHGCIVGWNGLIHYTTDGGDSWNEALTGTQKDFYGVELNADLTGYASGNGILCKTTDGGMTWLNQTGGIEGAWKNTIATKEGTVAPGEQVIICAHMDDYSEMPQTWAPGADDNGSGTVAVIEAARLFAEYNFEKTVKLCLWTGEEQGLLGSEAYAADAATAGDDIIGVYNFDMIGYDGNDDHVGELHCGTMSSSLVLGNIFEDVIDEYGIDLTPQLLTSGSTDRSDHASFQLSPPSVV